MTGVIFAGALFGLGVLITIQGLRRRAVFAVGARTHAGLDLADIGARIGPAVLRGAAAVRLDPGGRLAADLAVVGRRVEDHAARSVLAGLWLASLVVVLAFALGAGGVEISGSWVAVGAVVASIAGPSAATLALKAEATERRNDLLVDLGAYADLVVLLLAAGSGIEGALTAAADAGDDWTWHQLRDSLRSARLTRRTPAEALTHLGHTLGLVELEEFGAAVALASSSGSRLRESLAARSDALRVRELARVQAQAASATERMTFPVVALALGFLVILGFPAVSRVLTGF